MRIPLGDVTAVLQALAPLHLAADWDNVGLLWAPSRPRPVGRILLTIDLTPAVVGEAITGRADLVVAYHPPIFQPLRRISAPLVSLIEHTIAVYSPHTALDAAPGGVNDWLASAFGPGELTAIVPAAPPLGEDPQAPQRACVGQGRIITLHRALSLAGAQKRLKSHLGLAALRVARAERHAGGAAICRIALCAGAGGALLSPLQDCDLFVTGEMRHHDILAATARGTSVFLTDHSHSERGYLCLLGERLQAQLGGGVMIALARTDREPLEVV